MTFKPNAPTDIQTRLKSIAGLEDGWFDQESRAFDSSELSWLGELLIRATTEAGIPPPFLSPLAEGDRIQAEWNLGKAGGLDIEFHLKERHAEALVFYRDLELKVAFLKTYK